MLTEEIVRQLKLTHFLRGLDEAHLQSLAENLERRSLAAGELLFVQGDSPDGLHIVLKGSLALLGQDDRGRPLRRQRMEEGSLLGARELMTARSFPAAVRAEGPCELLIWDKSSLYRFLESHPASLASMRLTAQTQAFLLKRKFNWLAEDEAAFALGRRHASLLAYRLILPAGLAAGAAALAWWSTTTVVNLYAWASALLAVISAGLALWQWIDWRNDFYIVTDQRAVWVEKVVAIYDSRVETPLHQVLAVSVSSDMLGRWIGYGDVVIRTYTGEIQFEHVGRPQAVAAIIEERWRRLQVDQRESGRAAKLEAVRGLVEGGEESGADSDPESAPAAPPGESDAAREIGLNHWNFELRFEEAGVITYRKHWAVLLREIGLPSALFLLIIGVIGARLGGLLPPRPLPAFPLLAGGALVAAVAWWLYRFADWANDIYQVSRTHVIDVYRKPLGRELRRAAPLENILSTEVDRRGIIGLLLDFGDVRVNVGAEQLDFEGVFHPNAVQQDVVRAQEAFLSRKREAEEQERKREMVEWLDVYHAEIASQKHERRQATDTDDYP